MNSDMNKTTEDILDGVSCTVENCKYHDNAEDLCTASRITVTEQKKSCNETDTFCGTFISQE